MYRLFTIFACTFAVLFSKMIGLYSLVEYLSISDLEIRIISPFFNSDGILPEFHILL